MRGSTRRVLVHVSASSEDFKNNVLAPLKSAYLYEESKQSFRYKSAVLIKNPALERKYNAFRARRREEGYSEEDLKESYGFLLFDDVNKANALGETGVLAGNSTCTTLGDPSKGVYISMYSDCLDQNRWYHGKSGYIAIIRLTKGRVKRVLENYTQNFTAPTEGFDCHVSEQLPSVSSKTSSFLAFERTQYYMYELPGDGSNDTALSPSGACPFAIVPFSYTDTKQESYLIYCYEYAPHFKLFYLITFFPVCHYFPWSGQLQIGTHCYDVGLRSTAGALIPAELPPVVKVDRAISMLDLRQLLPRTIFETCLSGEVFLDGLHCSLYEMVSSEVEETSSLSLLLWEIKEKDVALIVPLNDGGFLILLHSSHFFTYDDSGSSAAEVLQGMFVFPESRVIYRGTKGGQRKPALSSEILRVLPVLSYAEGEVEKTPIDPSEELCEVFAQHMQSYAALINPGLALSPSRDISIFPDQYDVQDAHKHLYSSPEWTNRAWQSFRSYLSKPDSFQLPVSKASEILAAGQQERIEDLDDDVYFCLSSPEEAPANHVSMDSEDQLTDQKSGVNVETSVDSSITSAEAQVDLTAVSQNAVPDDLQAGDATKDTRKSDLTLLIKADDMGAKNSLTPSTSDDLPAELIVSITSAERTLTARSVISTESADETVKTKEVFDCSEVTNLTKTNGRKLHKEHSKGQKHVSKACNETPSLQTVNMQVEDDNLKSQKEDQAKVSSGHPQLSNPSNTDWRKVRRRKRIFGKLSAKNKKVKSAIIDLAVAEKKKSDPEQQSFKSTIVMELDPCPHRKKTERWDLKPVISTCGRILVPHGYVDIADQIKTLKDKSLSTKDEQFPENMLVDDSVNAEDRVKVEKESSTALETAVDKTEATTSKGGGNHPQNVDVSNVSPEHSVLRQSEDGSGLLTLNSESSEHHSKNDGINTPFKTVQEKHTDTPSSGKCAAKGEFLLSKLKSVLLRGKRKTSVLVSEETTADTAQDTQPCLKKGKVDSDSGKLKSNETINPSVQEVSKMVSVDPLFAFALGLTPKETPDKIQKSQGQDTQQRKDSSETQEQTILDKQPQIIQRKTVKEKSSSACSSTDALNLLADLALSASNDQVPPQPEPALEREPETSLKKCDLTLTSAEQESVLHALLRQPAARPIQPHESPSPSHLVGGSELVGLVSKEHAYSLPPSSSLLLGLSGTPFQVSPLSGSTRLLHHHQTMYGDGIKTLHPCVDQEDGSEHNSRFKKHMVRLRKFRHSRTFVNKDGSIQVTRQWKENYDFNLDSKFTCDSKDKAIIRALHGPWDYTIQDTNEEVRLIVHMWIGLFYSRSTARFFHVDSNSSEGSDSLEKSHGMMSAPAQTEFKADPFAPFPNVTDTTDTLISKALDLSKKNYSVLDQGTVILDLSLRNSSAEIVTSDPQVNKKMTFVSEQKEAGDTLNSLKSSMEPQNATQPGMEPVHNEPTVEENPENGVCLAELNVQPLPMSDGQDSAREDCITECNLKAPLDKQPAQADNKEDTPHYLQLRTQCANGSELTEENAISENVQSGMEPVHNEPTVEENPENGVCLADLNDHPLPMMCDGPDSVKDCITECNRKAPLDEQLPKADNKEHARYDLQLRIQCSDGSVLTEENAISEKAPTGMEPIHNKPAGEENQENGICLADLNDQPLPMMCDGPDSVKDCVTKCNLKAPLDKQPSQCANGSELTEENAISENAPSAMEPVHNKPAVEENPENGICLADLNDQLLPMICDGPDSVKKDNITECNRQAPLNEQPPKTDNKENACYDLQLRTQCGNGSALTEENAISENTPSGMEPIHNKPAVEESPENGICLADLNDQPIPMMCDNPDSVKKDCITECNHQEPLDEQLSQADNEEHACHDLEFRKLCGNGNGSSADGSIPQINDSVEIGSPNKVMANFSLSSADHEDGDAKSVEEVSHLPECKGVTKSEAEVTLPKEMALKSDTINKGLEKIHCRVVIPFIGIDTSGEDAVQPHDSHSECKVEEFQGQKGIPFISDSTYPDTVLPTEICSTSQLYSNNSELFDGKISLKLLDVSETNQPEVSGSESDDRCPTPTMDEKPYQYVTCSGPSSSSVFSGSKTGKNMTQKCLTRSSSFLKDKMPLEQKHKSTVNSDPNLHFGLHPDLELRTLRVLQSIDKFLFKSSHTDNASQIKTGDVRHSLDQIPNTSSKYIPTCLTPSHIFADFKGKKISNTKSVVVSACTSQELQTESSGFKSIDSLQAIKPNVDQDKHKTTLHTNLSHEPRSYSQRPVMAVKPSKSDEVQGDCILKDRESENSVMSIFSKDKPTKSPVVPYTTPAPMLFKKKTESLEGNSEGLNDNQQEASELSNSDLSKFGVQDPSYKGRDIPSSFLPMQSFEYAKTSSKLVDENQIFLTKSFDEKIGQMAKESIEMDQKDCPGASTSVVDYKDDSTIDDSLFLGPESSLTCTVYNTGHDRSYSFLEQLSQRCLQDDLTRASMEQECLIFSQQMQQLLKRSKRGPIHQLDEHDKFNLSSSSPVTVHFSSLEEQEDSVDHLDALSLVGQKIKVDMSDTKDLADTADEGNALHPQNLSEGTGNQMEHAGVSGLTAECARQYTAMMNDVVKRVPSRPKHFRMDRGYSKTEQSNHFDFCGQMKREMDESFRSSLNSVVKKSCKTKYRFYILVTSDDAFFEETKLEAEGHSAVQPSDFFLGDDSSSSLLIILKNEDIAEHICEVPHLLELKKSPSVQFAGIDEPDDVVNLTHQELFMRGGFIMFDRAALESLSLCNMKKMAEILQELSRTGKWKWMLHYRDSRRLKENARLTAEAKEKKHFINWCQEVGILEALPYHECDLMSRDQPDYLTCLVRLQVQNISARYPIFITDTTTDIAFGTNGILTMNFNSFLTCSPSETFTA
uniref:DUF3715 domain-containing protein n=1 Tax=Dicentrarchus labrax TaxID=13489 RepID=A0A8C4NZD9_DICLA